MTTDRSSPSSEGGFTLVEVISAALIAIISVLGLAYMFSTSRGLVDRYATARDGFAAAEQRLERLSMLGLKDPKHPELQADPTPGVPLVHGPYPRTLNGRITGSERWTVEWVPDPADDAGGDANPRDYKLATVEVTWTWGSIQDTVRISRVLFGY